MKYRKLRIAWSVAWGILCLALIALWIRSYWNFDALGRVGSEQFMSIGIASGTLYFTFMDLKAVYGDDFTPVETDGWDYKTIDYLPMQFNAPGWQFIWGAKEKAVSVRAWSLTLFFFALAIVPWIRWRFSLRTLLIAMTVAAIGLGWVVYALRG